MAWLFKKKDAEGEAQEAESQEIDPQSDGAPPLDQAQSFWSAVMPVMACGAGLFSDGYINNVLPPLSAPLTRFARDIVRS